MVTSRSTLTRAVLTGVAVVLLVFPVLSVVGLFGQPTWWLVLLVSVGITAIVTAGVLVRRRRDEVGDSTVWDAIPDWQYDGRHVESGGLARSEQEQTLREIRERAESKRGQR